MSRFRLVLIIILLTFVPVLLCSARQGLAHGVRGVIGMSETICVTATYDDGEPISYSEVEIVAPLSKLSFQSGRTDRNGIFCFQPDNLGEWQVSVSDGMGHRVRLQTMISEDMVLASRETRQEGSGPFMDKTTGLISGLSLIFGLSGFFVGLRNRKKN